MRSIRTPDVESAEELDQVSRHNKYVSPFCKVMVYIGLGEKDRAFEWLERAKERIWHLGVLAADPMFDPLRPDPRYTDLIQRMNLTAAANRSRSAEPLYLTLFCGGERREGAGARDAIRALVETIVLEPDA